MSQKIRRGPSGPDGLFIYEALVDVSAAVGAVVAVNVPVSGARVGDVPISTSRGTLPTGLGLAGTKTVDTNGVVTVYFVNGGPGTSYSAVPIDINLLRS